LAGTLPQDPTGSLQCSAVPYAECQWPLIARKERKKCEKNGKEDGKEEACSLKLEKIQPFQGLGQIDAIDLSQKYVFPFRT